MEPQLSVMWPSLAQLVPTEEDTRDNTMGPEVQLIRPSFPVCSEYGSIALDSSRGKTLRVRIPERVESEEQLDNQRI